MIMLYDIVDFKIGRYPGGSEPIIEPLKSEISPSNSIRGSERNLKHGKDLMYSFWF